MLQENFKMNAKGHVKLDLYDENGEVFFTKEKHNLVVLGANKIVGQAFADPVRTTKANQVDTGSSSLTKNTDGTFTFDLAHQREEIKTFTVDLGGNNTNKDVVISTSGNLVAGLDKVVLGGNTLVIDQDVYIKDPDAGIITFAAAPTGILSVTFHQVKNGYVSVVPGSETVKANGITYTRALTPSDDNNQYAIDYKLGKVFFASPKANVEVDYKFKVPYSLAFMGLADKPTGHPDYKPVSFSQLDKLKQFMENEFVGARQLIQYPAVVGDGDPELESFPTKIMAKTELNLTLVGDGSTTAFALTNAGGKLLTDIVSVKDMTDPSKTVDLTSTVTIKDANAAIIQFATAPANASQIVVDFKVRDNVDYTIFTMSQGPVLELDSVVHEDLTGKLTSFSIQNKGLVVGTGDVWIMNATAGIIQFSTNPSCGISPDKPGQFTFTYRVNSGTSVQFVADFPKGIPGPVLTDNAETLPLTNGLSTYGLQYPIAKDTSGNLIIKSIARVTAAGVSTNLVKDTDYTVSADCTQIILNLAITTGDKLNITYKYLKDTHDIYQVGMFTEQTDGEMFNISGIGPVTKDKNTGMRITWTVTF